MADMQRVLSVVGDTFGMPLPQGIRMTEFIIDNGIKNVLELGFAHGVKW